MRLINKKKGFKKKLLKQIEDNAEELRNMGICYVTEEEYKSKPGMYRYRHGVIPIG